MYECIWRIPVCPFWLAFCFKVFRGGSNLLAESLGLRWLSAQKIDNAHFPKNTWLADKLCPLKAVWRLCGFAFLMMLPKSLDTCQKLYSRIFFSNILTYLERIWQPWPWGECSKVVSSFCWQGRLWTLLSWLLSGVRTPSDPTPVKPNLCRRCVGKRSSRWATRGIWRKRAPPGLL